MKYGILLCSTLFERCQRLSRIEIELMSVHCITKITECDSTCTERQMQPINRQLLLFSNLERPRGI
jgi:hypothetical protein